MSHGQLILRDEKLWHLLPTNRYSIDVHIVKLTTQNGVQLCDSIIAVLYVFDMLYNFASFVLTVYRRLRSFQYHDDSIGKSSLGSLG